jgi:hypothetical protein
LLLLGLGSASVVRADVDNGHEAQLASAYIFNFMKFVDWPPHVRADALEVCFAAASSVRDAFAKATVDKRIGTRRIDVRALADADSAATCNVIYVDEQSDLQPPALHGAAALTIGKAPSFLGAGGIIQLYTENNRLSFAISVDNARRAQLAVRSDLLKLAAHVEQSTRR